MMVSVVIPTYNPHAKRLQRTLAGLREQTLPFEKWECLLIDNASVPGLRIDDWVSAVPANLRIITEPRLGLTQARRTGFSAARGNLIVMVDDDNVLAPDYLSQVTKFFFENPKLGAAGGKVVPELDTTKPGWWRPEFDGLLACRDLGPDAQVTFDHINPVTEIRDYPVTAPVGAGMAMRRTALQSWLDDPDAASLSDRCGGELTSGGDNDIILTLLRAGWAVGYHPDLSLTHLIPAKRLTRNYLARLNHGIALSWVQVLHRHHANPWRPVSRWSVPLRQLKAWFTYRAWTGPAAHIRWRGACGHFTGLSLIKLQNQL